MALTEEVKKLGLRDSAPSICVYEGDYNHHKNSKHRIKMIIKGKWMNDNKFVLYFTSVASIDYATGSTYAHAAFTHFNFEKLALLGK